MSTEAIATQTPVTPMPPAPNGCGGWRYGLTAVYVLGFAFSLPVFTRMVWTGVSTPKHVGEAALVLLLALVYAGFWPVTLLAILLWLLMSVPI